MYRLIPRLCIALAVTAGIIAGASAQDLRFTFKTPETAADFWGAVHYELELGNHKRASAMLDGFYKKLLELGDKGNPLLLQIFDEQGMSAFLRLANVPELRKVVAKDPADNKDRPITDILIDRTTQAVNTRLKDPDRIKLFIGQLKKSPEERAYAIEQLRRSGAVAIPHLIDGLRDDTRRKEHPLIAEALLKMRPDVVPPLLAAFDIAEPPHLRSILISHMVQRVEPRVVPYLWYVSGLPAAPDALRKQAADALARFLSSEPQKLGDPRAALTREAERYYLHQAKLPPESKVWRLDEKGQTLALITVTDVGKERDTLTPAEVEDYYGVYWAKKALELDANYRPAQVLLLSLYLDKVYRQGPMEKPLGQVAPELHKLLTGIDSSLLEAVLDRALAERRSAVALGAVQALAQTGEGRLIRPSAGGSPPLIRALNYPDRRVQIAAADAILQIPTTTAFPGSARVVEILIRALSSDGTPKALVIHPEPEQGDKLVGLVRQWPGYAAESLKSGRQALQRAMESPDIELIILDSRQHDPALPYLLAQLRGTPETSGIPLILTGPADQERGLQANAERYRPLLVVTPAPLTSDVLKLKAADFLAPEKSGAPLTEIERKAHAELALRWLGRVARGEKPGYDIRPAEATIRDTLLKNNDLAPLAAEALAFRPGRPNQEALSDTVTGARPNPVRTAAVRALRGHIQRHGLLLKPEQLAAILKLQGMADDPALQEELTRFALSLDGASGQPGNRLKQFDPTPPKPAAPGGQ